VVDVGDSALQDDPIMDSLQMRMGLGMNPISGIKLADQDLTAENPDSLIEGMMDKIENSLDNCDIEGGNILGEHLQVINSL
jgi:hypothetical protein